MLRSRRLFPCVLVFGAGCAFGTAHAITAGISVRAQANASANPAFQYCEIYDSPDASKACVAGPATTPSNGTSFGYGYGNIATGELKAVAKVAAANDAELEGTSSFGVAEIVQGFSFTRSGSDLGTITVYLGVNGNWNLNQVPPPGLGFQILDRLDLIRGTTSSNVLVATDHFGGDQNTLPASGSTDQVLSATYSTFDATGHFFLDAYMLSQITQANGSIDFGHTGTLFVTATPNVTIAFDDERFLTDPAFLRADVPEPTTLAILGLGLAGLGLMRRKRAA